MTKLSVFEATMIAEGDFGAAGFIENEVTNELIMEAWQKLIDTGVVWKLQGSFGRMAQRLIDQGLCQEA